LGVREGDVVAAWDGRPVNAETVREVFEAFGDTYDPERTYAITLRRGGDTTQVSGRIPFLTRLRTDLQIDPNALPFARAIRESIFGRDEED
jgi:hypothetical protein